MTRAFDLALHQATNMFRRRSSNLPKITIGIDFNQSSMPMAGGGGISSIQKRMNIGGEPHRLAYINSDEASLLKQLGGSGQPVRGIPAYQSEDDDPEGAGYSGFAAHGGFDDPADPGEVGFDEGAFDPDPDEAAIGTLAENVAQAKAMANANAMLGLLSPKEKITHQQNLIDKLKKQGENVGLHPIPALFSLPFRGLGAYYRDQGNKTMEEYHATKSARDDPNTPVEQREALDEKLDAMEQEWSGVYSRKSLKEYDDMVRGEHQEVDEGAPTSAVAEAEAEKLRGMSAYFAKMGGVSPLGFTDAEIELLKKIYPPDHPIWETINREREPMWPSIEEETAVV
jgi:hypothetical protein